MDMDIIIHRILNMQDSLKMGLEMEKGWRCLRVKVYLKVFL